jgi:hypothetical protein
MAITRLAAPGHSHRHLKRAASILGVVLLVGTLAVVLRTLSAGGSFAEVRPGYTGHCVLAASLAVRDIAVDARSKLAFLAVAAPQPAADDGIYLVNPAHPEAPPQRLGGVPPGFHPTALALWRDGNGPLVLFAASPGPQSGMVDIFSVQLGAHPQLSETAAISSSLFAHVRALAALDANRFYALDAPRVAGDFLSLLRSYVTPAKGRIIFYDGQIPHLVAKGLRAPRGLALSTDGSRLYVGLAVSRVLESYAVEPFMGTLTLAGRYPLPLAPGAITPYGQHSLLIAGDPKLFARARFEHDPRAPSPSAVIRVELSGGLPHGLSQIYADLGHPIAAAGVAVQAGAHLLIGSALGHRLLNCQPF